jgi:hypothetical protein
LYHGTHGAINNKDALIQFLADCIHKKMAAEIFGKKQA